MKFRSLLIFVFLSSCTLTPQHEDEFLYAKDFSIHQLLNDEPNPGCTAMFDGYCDVLYSPGSNGNLKIHNGKESLEIFQGKTSNDFSNAFYSYSKAKIRNKNSLPPDFQKTLEDSSYFLKLNAFLSLPQPELMSLEKKLNAIRSNHELGGLWESAISETVILRMNRIYPDFHQLREDQIPVEMHVEMKRERRKLISNISKSIWKHDLKWKKVETSFEEVKAHFLAMISKLKIDPKIKNDWSNKIRDIELVIPGAVPEISDAECSTTQANAFYYNHLNLLTVCAGDFNSEDILETLAHEIAHAIDLERYSYLFQVNSSLGKSITQLRKEVCEIKNFSCQSWNEFKNKFDQQLDDFSDFEVQLPQFQRCLKRRTAHEEIEDEDIERIAHENVTDSIADLAGSDVFLRITKEKIPYPNKKMGSNRNYLNPCNYYLWSKGEEPLDDELNTLIYFTAEYRCSSGDNRERLKNAIEVAKKFSLKVAKGILEYEGEFSSDSSMESEGYSSSPVERFADVLGSYALADLLSTYPRKLDRRNAYLASSSWLCSKPSLASLFPEEETVQQEYSFDSHTGTNERKKEYFTTPMRQVLGCKKDFQFNECSLPFN